jgi:LytR cell envelope-related transcriptional attenuator
MARVNLGTGRIIVIVALVVAGLAILANGFSDGASVAAPGGGTVVSPTGSASVTPSAGTSHTVSASPLPDPQQPDQVTVAVFNGTSAAGLAAQGDQTLTDAGYVSGQVPADSPVKPIAKTTIYYRTGPKAAQNQADAQEIADTLFKGAKVAELGADFESVVDKSVQVVVVLGQNYADKVGG